MKKEFIKNILGNSQKRTYRREIFRQRLSGFMWCLIIIALIACPIYDKYRKSNGLKPVGQTIESKVIVEAKEDKRRCDDPMSYLRCRAQDLGINDFTTSKIINMISTCENSKWDPEAININTDKHRSMDVGIMMINLYWHPDVKLSDMIDYKKNIDYGLNMFLDQGFEPWSCAHKLGYVK